MNYSKSKIHLTGVAGLLLLAISGYVLSILPYQNVRSQAEQARHEAERLGRLLPRIQSDHRALQAELASLPDAQKFEQGDAQPVLQLISAMLHQRSLNLVNFNESNTTQISTDIELRLLGEYQNMLRFVHDLGLQGLPTRITNFELSARNQQGSLCSATIKVHCTLDMEASMLSMR